MEFLTIPIENGVAINRRLYIFDSVEANASIFVFDYSHRRVVLRKTVLNWDNS